MNQRNPSEFLKKKETDLKVVLSLRINTRSARYGELRIFKTVLPLSIFAFFAFQYETQGTVALRLPGRQNRLTSLQSNFERTCICVIEKRDKAIL